MGEHCFVEKLPDVTQDRNKKSFVVRFCECLSTIDGIKLKRAKGYLHIVFNAEASAL